MNPAARHRWVKGVESLGAAYAPLLRFRPDVLKELIGQVTACGPECVSSQGGNEMPSHEEEAAAYAATDPYAPGYGGPNHSDFR